MNQNATLIARALLILLSSVAGESALAQQCSATGNTCGTASNASEASANGPSGAGNPIDFTSGNKYQYENDLRWAGPLALEFSRHYNSLGTQSREFGQGWTHSYETRLTQISRSDAKGQRHPSIQVRQADGRLISFEPAGAATDGVRLYHSVPKGYGVIAERVALVERLRHSTGKNFATSADDPVQMRPWEWRWLEGRTIAFDGRGLARRIENPDGDRLDLDYDRDTRLMRIADAVGRAATFDYWDDAQERLSQFGNQTARTRVELPLGARGRLKSVSGPDGTKLRYGYDAAGMLAGVWYEDGTVRRYEYVESAGAHRLARIVGRDGKLVGEYGYDEYGRAVSTSGADGYGKIELEYRLTARKGEPNATWLRNSVGGISVYRWVSLPGEPAARIVEAVGPGCSQCPVSNIRYGYDSAGRITRVEKLAPADPMKVRAGQVIERFSASYDSLGRVLESRRLTAANQPGALIERREYTGDFGKPSLVARPSVFAGREHVLVTEFNPRGQPLRITETGFSPDGTSLTRTTNLGYQVIAGRNRLVRIDGPLANGPTATPADSDITLYRYDTAGARVAQITQPMNLRTVLEHDRLGRLLKTTGPAGLTDRFRYGRGEELLAAMQSETVGVAYTYDLLGRIVETSSIAGERHQPQMRFGYDDRGRLAFEADARGTLKRATYDSEGRLIESSVSRGSMREFERYGYDELGRMAVVADHTGAVHRIAYDEAGRLSGISDPNDRLQMFVYSPEGRVATSILAANTDATTSVDYGFDPAGGIERVSLRGDANRDARAIHSTRVVRDDFGREVAVQSPDGGPETRVFDAANRLVRMTSAAGEASYEYDAAGRIVRQTIVDASTATREITRWEYRGARLAAVIHPNQTERYRYDEEGRVTARTVEVALQVAGADPVVAETRYEYDAAGALVSMSLPDGSDLELVRNPLDQVIAIKRHRIHTRWLRWMLPEQTLVSEVDADLKGLRHYLAGNGIEAWSLRSEEGVLARTIYRARGAAGDAGARQVAASERLLLGALGIADARAAAATPSATLLERRYTWDVGGNLRNVTDTTGAATSQREFIYDAHDRLTIANRKLGGTLRVAQDSSADTQRFDRFYYDGFGNRVLGQRAARSSDDYQTNSFEWRYAEGSNRAVDVAGAVNEYDAAGRPRRMGNRQFVWDAVGRLREIREHQNDADVVLASYTYNHRGERIAKRVAGHSTGYLYDARRLTAELDSRGRLTRQYVYLGELPIAMIDTPQGTDAADGTGAGHDIATAFSAWFGADDRIVYLHANHLGAPEIGTDAAGDVIWRADYDAFGQASVAGSIDVNLRLPGQYADTESGLHYNDRRYYDPNSGRYLSPDPLGLAGGFNAYAYAGGNPQKNIDPTGLILIAFDGTGNNSNLDSPQRDFTNIWWMYMYYDLDAAGQQFRSYERGVGTNPDSWQITRNIEMGLGHEGHDLINDQLRALDNYMSSLEDPRETVILDVIGFSRGAAQARDFANRVIQRYHQYYYGAHCIEFRFLGLFETVSQFGRDGARDDEYDFHIAPEWQAVSQAYALNEHRRLFPLRHIERGNEQAFIGAHSDIGGGYNIASEERPGDLSDVALNWMIDQARAAGVVFLPLDPSLREVTNPVVHDQRNTSIFYGMRYEQPVYDIDTQQVIRVIPPDERGVIMPDGSRIPQPQFAYSDPRWGPMMEGLIQRPANWEMRTDNCGGQVDMANYRIWLQERYNLTINPAANEGRTQPCVRGTL